MFRPAEFAVMSLLKPVSVSIPNCRESCRQFTGPFSLLEKVGASRISRMVENKSSG